MTGIAAVGLCLIFLVIVFIDLFFLVIIKSFKKNKNKHIERKEARDKVVAYAKIFGIKAKLFESDDKLRARVSSTLLAEAQKIDQIPYLIELDRIERVAGINKKNKRKKKQ